MYQSLGRWDRVLALNYGTCEDRRKSGAGGSGFLLRKYHNSELVLNPRDPVIDTSLFKHKDWTSTGFGHVNGKEDLPPKMHQPRGLGFVLQTKVDVYHADDTVTRRSRIGFLIYLKCDTVYWFSKKQTSVESIRFVSEFVAMKQCCEYL